MVLIQVDKYALCRDATISCDPVVLEYFRTTHIHSRRRGLAPRCQHECKQLSSTRTCGGASRLRSVHAIPAV